MEGGCKTTRDPAHPNHQPKQWANRDLEAALLQNLPKDKAEETANMQLLPMQETERAKGREIHMDTGQKFISTYRVQVNAVGIFTSSS